jgi:hypothetical protein
VDDDGTGWNEVLVGGWSDAVRRAVVRRVERLAVGWRGPLVRTLADEDGVDGAWTETLHRTVLHAIAEETGADLDELGSQAAWACYDEVWAALAERWGDGGELAVVPLGAEPLVSSLIAGLPPEAAAAAGADVRGTTPDPLWVRGRLRVDVEGLRDLLARGGSDPAVELRVETLLQRLAAG